MKTISGKNCLEDFCHSLLLDIIDLVKNEELLGPNNCNHLCNKSGSVKNAS